MAIVYMSYLVMSGILDAPVEVSAEVKVKKPRASRAKPKAVDVSGETPVDVPVKKPRASRAKPKAVDVSGETPVDVPVKKPRASRAKPKVVDAPVEASAEVPAEAKVKKPRASRAKPKAVEVSAVAIGSPEITGGNVAMPQISQMLPDADPKWIKFRDVLSSGKYDKLRADGGFHPGEMSIHVSRALGDHPEWRPLMRDLLEARGRKDVMRVFGL